ncbi:single-stranded DNA-binding protein [Microbacterium album]|uniref:Single-stranded DNA-binding protein n=1 Tax=Microbacterium album TaxID=2053191 RepID=A0A917IDR4_9MICO|nr:single-stranded DNA-binding protein [Microbacterium album]GGH39097.1 single-stranded DNA-binding protein [Microbacterium album]
MSDIITITGNIATDPLHQTTNTGVPVTRFRLASSQRRFDRDSGQWVEGATNWYSVSAFRALAENAHASLRKGQRVVVTGRLRLRAWERDGRKGMEAEIDADALGHDLRFGTSAFTRRGAVAPGDSAPQDAAGPSSGDDAWAPAATSAPGDPDDHGDTPF